MSNKVHISTIVANAHSGLGTTSAAECMGALERISTFLLTIAADMGREMPKARAIFKRIKAGYLERTDAAVIRALLAKAKTVIDAAGGATNKKGLREVATKLELLARAAEKYFKAEDARAARREASAKIARKAPSFCDAATPSPMLSVTSHGGLHTGHTEVQLEGRKVGGIIGIVLEARINDVWRAKIDCYVDSVDVKAIIDGINYHNKPPANSRGEIDVTSLGSASRTFVKAP